MNIKKAPKTDEEIRKDAKEISLEGEYSDSLENYFYKKIRLYAETQCSIKDFYECQKKYSYTFYWNCEKEINAWHGCLGSYSTKTNLNYLRHLYANGKLKKDEIDFELVRLEDEKD